MSWGWDVADESWFLEVVNRVASGETLYRDVYLHVTPLSAYIMVALVKVFGAQIMVLKAANALVFAGTALLASRIAWQLGATRRYSLLLLVSLFVFGSPARLLLVMFYSQVAGFFLLATLSLWLSWRETGNLRPLVGAGIALGLCFASKQNVGAYAAGAFVIATVGAAWAENRGVLWAAKAVTRAGAVAAATTAIVFLPVALGGGLPRLSDFGLQGMSSYLTHGGMWYFKPVYSLVELLHHPHYVDALRWINAAIPFLVPIILLPMLTAVAERSQRARQPATIAVAAFTGAAMATLYPRADPQHMIFVAPMLVIALGYCWQELTRDTTTLWIPALTRFTLAGVLAILVMMTASAAGRASSPAYTWSRLPHHRGPLMLRVLHDKLQSNVAELKSLPRDRRTFFLGPYAAFYYLAAGMGNPTPYDYPYEVALGGNGPAEIENAISGGQISRVCIEPGVIPELRARGLEDYVRGHMVRQEAPAFCEMYAAPDAALRILPR